MSRLINYGSDAIQTLYDYSNYDGSTNTDLTENTTHSIQTDQQHHVVTIHDEHNRIPEIAAAEESSEDNFYAEHNSDDEQNQQFYEAKTEARILEEKIDGLMILVEEKYPNHRSEKRQNITVVYETFKNRAVGYTNSSDFEYLEDDSSIVLTSEMIESGRPFLRDIVSNNYLSLYYCDILQNYEDCMRSEASRPIGTGNGAFLVNASLDYIYSFVLEKALLEDYYPELYMKSLENFSKRRNAFVACQGDHFTNGVKLCSKEWVIYTQLSSNFAIRCMKFLSDSEIIDYTLDTPFSTSGREYVSFHLVLFLCGEHIYGLHDSIPERVKKQNIPIDSFNFSASDGNEMSIVNEGGGGGEEKAIALTREEEDGDDEKNLLYYNNTNQWIKLPIWFYDIWQKCIEADAAKF